jgi:hypothetical protein
MLDYVIDPDLNVETSFYRKVCFLRTLSDSSLISCAVCEQEAYESFDLRTQMGCSAIPHRRQPRRRACHGPRRRNIAQRGEGRRAFGAGATEVSQLIPTSTYPQVVCSALTPRLLPILPPPPQSFVHRQCCMPIMYMTRCYDCLVKLLCNLTGSRIRPGHTVKLISEGSDVIYFRPMRAIPASDLLPRPSPLPRLAHHHPRKEQSDPSNPGEQDEQGEPNRPLSWWEEGLDG